MNIFNNFLCKIFGVITLLFCYTVCGYAEESATIIRVICSAGYYVSSCGTKTIGTNWLKGIPDNTETPDYFSYNSAAYDNLTNLRKFFAGKEEISYMDIQGTPTTIPPTNIVNGEDRGYLESRNEIFKDFCTTCQQNPDSTTSCTLITSCKKCPNNAQVPQSTIGFNVQDKKFNLKTFTYIYTIADCYMTEFSDNTGTYVYVPNSAAQSSDSAKTCYFSDNIEGDELF